MGNENTVRPAPAERSANKAKAAFLMQAKKLPPGVEEKEMVTYIYQPATGDDKLDKLRNYLVDDYNTIVTRRLEIYQKMSNGASGIATREATREVQKMAEKAKKRYQQLEAEHRRPHPYPSHFDTAPKFK